MLTLKDPNFYFYSIKNATFTAIFSAYIETEASAYPLFALQKITFSELVD